MEHNKIFKIIKKVIVNLIIFLLSIIAIISIWAFVQLNVQNNEYINIFGYSVLSTETGSMAPTIAKGDIVIIKIGDEIRENDIITIRGKGKFIIFKIEGNTRKGNFIINIKKYV